MYSRHLYADTIKHPLIIDEYENVLLRVDAAHNHSSSLATRAALVINKPFAPLVLNPQESYLNHCDKKLLLQPELHADKPLGVPMVLLQSLHVDKAPQLQLPSNINVMVPSCGRNSSNSRPFLNKPPIQIIPPSSRLRGALPTVYQDMIRIKPILTTMQISDFNSCLSPLIMSLNKFCTAYADLAEYILCISEKHTSESPHELVLSLHGVSALIILIPQKDKINAPDVVLLTTKISELHNSRGKRQDTQNIFEIVVNIMLVLLNALDADLSEPPHSQALFSIENINTNGLKHFCKTADSPQIDMPISVLWKGMNKQLVIVNMRFNELHADILESAGYLRNLRGVKASLKSKSRKFKF